LVQLYLEPYFFYEWGPPKETKQFYEKRNKGKTAGNLVCFPSDQAFEGVQITVDIEQGRIGGGFYGKEDTDG
jgi:hypothetical protein